MFQQLTWSSAPVFVLKNIMNQRRMIGAMAIRLVAAATTFAATFIIAREYGAIVTGEYALFTQTIVTLGMIAIFGNEQLIVRRIASYLADERKDLARLSYTHASKLVLVTSLGFASILLLLSFWADQIGFAAPLLVIAALGVVLYALLHVTAAALRGSHFLVRSQALLALHPAVCLIMTLAVVIGWQGRPAIGLALGYIIGALSSVLVAMLLVRGLMKHWPVVDQKHPDDGRTNSTIFGLTIAVDTASGWIVLSMTAALLSLADAGIYRVCGQFMLIVGMVVTTYNGLISPQYAVLFKNGDVTAARRMHNRSIAFLLLAAGTPLLAIAIFAEPLLGLMGDEFREGSTALRILAAGQIAALSSGGAGAMISMSGREAYSLKLATFSFVVVIAAMLLLTPSFGLNGAALSLALMWVIRNLGSLIYARRMVRRQMPA